MGPRVYDHAVALRVVDGIVMYRNIVLIVAGWILRAATAQRGGMHLQAAAAMHILDQVPTHVDIIAIGGEIDRLEERRGVGRARIVDVVTVEINVTRLRGLETRASATPLRVGTGDIAAGETIVASAAG